ncbi:hypothetical protein C882_4014 [Caenispirillum salinarum AK4]|uniref:Uncharacterized protein n=1 Tax=Caenispirillum salinarum AK4 TaxID=1238182 RepID=K9HTU4_9PROT|nr:hypothetical protein C882_4014 [Caenispirillum salinarum AK4]
MLEGHSEVTSLDRRALSPHTEQAPALLFPYGSTERSLASCCVSEPETVSSATMNTSQTRIKPFS